MKKIYAFLFTLLLASGAAAQNPTAYFMEGSTLRSQFNPAFAPLRGYVNIPGLGGLDINVSGNLSIDKILYPRNGKLVTLLDSSVSTADALSGLKADNPPGSRHARKPHRVRRLHPQPQEFLVVRPQRPRHDRRHPALLALRLPETRQ